MKAICKIDCKITPDTTLLKRPKGLYVDKISFKKDNFYEYEIDTISYPTTIYHVWGGELENGKGYSVLSISPSKFQICFEDLREFNLNKLV
jgi:hypothetical protein